MAYRIDANLGPLNTAQGGHQLVRTRAGVLYAVLGTGARIVVYKSSDNGITWQLVDYANSPAASVTAVAIAIDSTDTIHIVYKPITITQIRYATINTTIDKFSIRQIVNSNGPTNLAIAVDSNDMPHIAWTVVAGDVRYSNRIQSNWKIPAIFIASTTDTVRGIDIQIDANNVPQVAAVSSIDGVRGSVGDKNNARSFTVQIFDTAFDLAGNSGIVIDNQGNTWIAYQAAVGSSIILAKHVKNDSWTVWTKFVSNSIGNSISMAADPTGIYLFYEMPKGGVAYNRYDTVNGVWLGEVVVQPVTATRNPGTPIVKWSQLNNNGDTGDNNGSQDTIDYLFDDGSTVYYDRLTTAQISTGYVTFNFAPPPAATTTSTSSTSSSISTSISTSSTSSSISTSSTSSSTSQSTSTSSTSSSTSQSTSTSSTSASTSTSTSSTSLSTSSTSSSTSKSTSTSSTSSSTSVSVSTSTSSTSSSISTSSTSSSTSLSTSSTSSSTSQSTSTSSTSSSTSKSTSTSSTSSSTSLSTSSTSSSTSFSTSSTSSSISTSSTSSSTSQSTSLSTSSTSSSTSTTQSITTSTSSTSSSISTSTSSTSSSTSISTSSTSTSKSTSTSSTSQSTSTSKSTSTSSTSQSISTSLSTSSTSSSTSQSTSTSSTSSSISTSTTTTPATTTSTSSTSSSTSTSTTLIDIDMIPRAIIRPDTVRGNALTSAQLRIRQIRLRLR